jgi:hypothetical protein
MVVWPHKLVKTGLQVESLSGDPLSKAGGISK